MSAAILFVCASSALDAQEVKVEARIETWFARVSGNLQFDEKPAVGDRIDLEDDLGMSGFDLAPALGLGIAFGRERIELQYAFWRFRSSEVLDAPLRFNETLFQAGEEVETRLTFTRWSLVYEHRFVEADGFELGAGIAARYWMIEPLLSSDAHGRDADHQGTLAPSPRVHARIRFAGDFFLDSSLEGIAFKLSDLTVQSVAFDASAGWSPIDWIVLAIGYRLERFDFVTSDSIQRNEVDCLLDGPFLTVQTRF